MDIILLKEIFKKHNFSDDEVKFIIIVIENIIRKLAREEAENVKDEYLDYINDPYR